MRFKLIIIIVLLSLTAIGCGQKNINTASSNGPDKNTNDNQTNTLNNFNLIFRYGVEAKNELNTYDQSFTKDMITSPSVTINFQLTANELISIKNKISEDNIFEPTIINANSGTSQIMSPCSSYYLQVEDQEKTKTISWDSCSGAMTSQQKDFSDFLINLIESRQEYKDLPPATGGYL